MWNVASATLDLTQAVGLSAVAENGSVVVVVEEADSNSEAASSASLGCSAPPTVKRVDASALAGTEMAQGRLAGRGSSEPAVAAGDHRGARAQLAEVAAKPPERVRWEIDIALTEAKAVADQSTLGSGAEA
jgi:hypothetical protein